MTSLPPEMNQALAEGGCLCGAVRYRATRMAIVTTLCHCRICRRAAGAPSVGWVIFPADGISFIAGKPVEYVSSPNGTRGFCGRCGTSLTYRDKRRPDRIDVTTASLDALEEFAPTKEIWTSHRIAWEALNPSLEQFPQSSKQEQEGY